MAPSAVNNAGREDEAILAKWYGDVSGSLASGGASSAYTLTLNRTKFDVTSSFDGFLIAFQANHANTGATTLNVTPSGGAAAGAKAVVKNYNSALVSGDIVAGQVVVVVYDNSLDKFQMISPVPVASTALENIVEDTTPQLGGDLDLNGNNIDFPTTANISDCLDEDDMVSDSATSLATQQSIKAYVDSQITSNDYVLVQHQVTSGTTGPTYTTASFQTVTLNTEVTDTGSVASVASNQITLAAGSYDFDAVAHAGKSHASINTTGRMRLYNATDASVIVQGVNGRVASGGGDALMLHAHGQFTIAASKAVELQIEVDATTDAGAAVSTGESEVYASIKLRRYAT